jgi:hypothetical protein
MVKHKNTKNGGSFRRLVTATATPFVRAALRGSRNTANTLLQQRPFTASTFSLAQIPRSSTINLGSGRMSIVPEIEYTDKDAGSTRDSRDSIRGRSKSKIDIGSTMMGTSSSVTTKIAIGTLITAFLSVLIGKPEIGAEIKSDTDDLVKKATDDIYDYMVAHASQRLQAGDTTIIASMYKTITKHTTLEDRKQILKKLDVEWIEEDRKSVV